MGFLEGLVSVHVFGACLLSLIALHEMGHIVAGKLVGFRFHSIQVGPVALRKTTAGWSLGFTGELWAGGMASMLPRDSRNLVARYRWFAAGGPIASFLPIVPAVVGTLQENRLAALMLLPSIIGFMGSAAPREGPEADGHLSDGSILSDSFRDPETMRRQILLWSVMGAWERGERPRDWPIALLQELPPELSPDESVAVHLLRYYHSLDCDQTLVAGQEIDAAAALLEDMRDSSMGVLVRLEQAFHHARHESASTSRALLNQIEVPEHLERVRLRAESAVLWAEGREQESEQRREEARALYPQESKLEDFDRVELGLLDAIGKP